MFNCAVCACNTWFSTEMQTWNSNLGSNLTLDLLICLFLQQSKKYKKHSPAKTCRVVTATSRITSLQLDLKPGRATNSWDPTNNDQQRLQRSQGLRSCTSSHKGKHFHSKRGCEVTSCVLFGPDFNEHASSSSLAAVCAVMWHICLHQTFAGVCIFWSIILLTYMTHTDVGYQMLQTCSVRLNTCAGVPRPSLCDSRVRGGAQC